MRQILPDECPQQKESWKDVLGDVEKIVFNGMTHWHSAGFFAYFPTGISYPDVLAEMLIAGSTSVGFTWVSYC